MIMDKTPVSMGDHMETQSYYLDVNSDGGNVRSDTQPLQVNCAGYYRSEKAFQTDNPLGREDYYLQVAMEGRMQV